MNVPFIELRTQQRNLRDELHRAMGRVVDRGDLALGEAVTGFVKALFGERWEMPFFGAQAEKLPTL